MQFIQIGRQAQAKTEQSCGADLGAPNPAFPKLSRGGFTGAMMFKEFLNATGAYFGALVLVVLVFSLLLFLVCGYQKHGGALRNLRSFVLYLGLVAIGTLFLVLFGGWMAGLGLSMAFGSFIVGFVAGRKEGVDQGMREGLGAMHDEAIERGFAFLDSCHRFVWKEKSQIKREP